MGPEEIVNATAASCGFLSQSTSCQPPTRPSKQPCTDNIHTLNRRTDITPLPALWTICCFHCVQLFPSFPYCSNFFNVVLYCSFKWCVPMSNAFKINSDLFLICTAKVQDGTFKRLQNITTSIQWPSIKQTLYSTHAVRYTTEQQNNTVCVHLYISVFHNSIQYFLV